MSSTPNLRPPPEPRRFLASPGSWAIALVLHVVLLVGLGMVYVSDRLAEPPPGEVLEARYTAAEVDESVEEVCYETAEVHEQEVECDLAYHESFGHGGVYEGPVVKDEELGISRQEALLRRVQGVRRRFQTEGYDRIRDNPFRRTTNADVSTFSVDVDTASYSNVRRFLTVNAKLPPKDAVRIEELLNYFPYRYAPPEAEATTPFRWHVDVAGCPWAPEHRLARIALKGRVLSRQARPPCNLVFLLDVSGSMDDPKKLPLLQRSIKALARRLRPQDRVAIVVYAGAAGVVLPSTSGDQGAVICDAVDRLQAGGSTNGGAGIQRAYQIAVKHYIEGGVNRVLLATDGDFNVGTTDRGALTRLIEEKAKTGVYLSVLGFGRGNYKDDAMESLSNTGNGNYAYIDDFREARKVLVEQASGTLVTIAKDVKIQIFFNPAHVAGYRLIGYENRILAREDFNDDKKDAGDIGAGHAVTALYELVLAGGTVPAADVDPNPFKRTAIKAIQDPATDPKALFRLRLRYKAPEGSTSTLREQDVADDGDLALAPEFRWAAAVAAFGMLLRDSPHKGTATFESVLALAESAVGDDPGGYRSEFVQLVKAARRLSH